MNFILSIIKFIKFKPIIKFKKFERHNYEGANLFVSVTWSKINGF